MRLKSALVACTAAVVLVAGCGGGSTSLKPKQGSSDGSVSTNATDTASTDTASGTNGSDKGNGVAAKSAKEILRLSQAAAKKESSVRLKGTIQPSGGRLKLDIHIGHDGGVGTVDESGKGGFQFVRQGPSIFIKGNDEFFRSFGGQSAATLLRGKWIKGSVRDSKLKSFASLTDRQKLFDSVLGHSSSLTKGAKTSVRGHPAIEVRGDNTVVLVATRGTPLPLQIRSQGSTTGALDLLEYGKDVPIEAPPSDLVVDVDKLRSSTDTDTGTDSGTTSDTGTSSDTGYFSGIHTA